MLKKKISSLIRNFLNKKGYLLINKSKSIVINLEVVYILLFSRIAQKNIKVIQIGANDGNDLLSMFNNNFRHKVHYIGIEPQEVPFNKLKKNYENFNNFFFLKSFIGKEGVQNFYYYNEKYLQLLSNKEFNLGTNSLVYENLANRLIKKNLDPKLYISAREVEVNSLYNVLKKNINLEDFKNIDLLQIDAEGYDDEVIYNSNLDFFKPNFINFEYKNLTKEKLDNLINFLNRNKYECLIYKYNDALAVRV
jgi:FkbM family methyltransferase